MQSAGLRLSILLLVLFGCSFHVGSQELSETVAHRCAQQHYNGLLQRRSQETLTLWRKTDGGFLYTTDRRKGFVWIGGTNDHPQVYGYALEGDVGQMGLSDVFHSMVNKTWKNVDQENSMCVSPVAPLLRSVWIQDAPYNGMCPYYINDEGITSTERCKVGCVATAVSEVLRHYAYPETLQDTLHGWSTPHYTIETVYPGTRLNWQSMLDRYDEGYSEEEARAVQELSLYCGMACRMNYGVDASGSNVYKLLEPMQRVFGYRYAQFYDRSRYSPRGWNKMLQYELQRGIPLVYSGYNWQLLGHAFVIDGVDKNGLYHVRWGEENGVYNGYFHIDILNMNEHPGLLSDFGRISGMHCNQAALALYPDSVPAYPGDTLTYKATDIVVERVEYQREMNTAGYVPMVVTLTNHSADTISYTMLMYRSERSDTIDWGNVGSMAMVTETLYPNTTTDVVMYPSFGKSGTYHWGLTGDMEHVLYAETVESEWVKRPKLSFLPLQVLSLSSDAVTLKAQVSNESSESSIATFYTYILRPSNRNEYPYRQNVIINLNKEEMLSDTVTFHALEPMTEYTLDVVYDSEVRASHTFQTSSATSVLSPLFTKNDWVSVYSLQGILLGQMRVQEVPHWMKRHPRGTYLLVTSDGKTKKVFSP